MARYLKKKGLALQAGENEKQIRELLAILAPNASAKALNLACEQVMDAAGDYRDAFSEQIDGHKVAPNASPIRRELDVLHNKFTELHTLFATLSKGAVMKVGHIRRPLEIALESADLALLKAIDRLPKEKSHQGDMYAPALSAQIRAVLTETLALKLSMSADDERIARQGRGANYARLLRCALIYAGAKPPSDMRDLMKAGKKS